MIEFRVLGSFEVVGQDGPVALGGPKQRALLAALIVHRGEVVSSERLVDEMWGEQAPASAIKLVQGYVSNLRKALGEGLLVTRGRGYALQLGAGQLDVDRFEAMVRGAQAASLEGDARTAAARLREALGLWRGPPLADFAYESFAQSEIARLEEARLAATESRIAAELELGEHALLVGELEALVREHPLREGFTAQLMLALYGSGRQSEALGAYQHTRLRLAEELGLEPGPELKALQTAILNQEPWLARPTRVDAGDRLHSPVAGGASAAVLLPDATSSRRERAPAHDLPETQPVRVRQARKVVTVLFCDVIGSTALGEELDPEVLRGVMNRYFAALRATIERHGGTVEKFIGDAVVAVFGIPRVREDDALRAVRAAWEIRQRLPAVADEVGVALRFRTGVNTGVVLAGEGENLAIGDAVNVAARLEQAAQPEEILLGAETLRLVRDAVTVEPLEPLALKGKSQPTLAFRLLDVDPRAPGFARHLDVPLVGRERELRLLREAWDRAVAESGCHLFTLLGLAGVGKSRLVAELLAELGDEAWVLSGRCLHYGEGITFWPLIEALTELGEPADGMLERLRSGGVARPEELFLELRRWLESLARERPVVLYVDDLQWAEPMLLDLLDHLVELSRGSPILLLCTARPELLDDRPGWGGGKLNATTVMLAPLSTGESEALLELLGGGLDPSLRARVVVRSEGNPLFLEEMAALGRETGTADVPATIRALLAARLERLAVEERALLECGAVEGEVFHRPAVRALSDALTASEADRQLAGLIRKELIRPHPATIHGEEAFRFRHLLIRDVAYDALPKAVRADLHERFARWLEQAVGAIVEVDEIAGWHLEEAIRYRHELGKDVGNELRWAAADHLHAAGRRARERRDVPASRHFLERAMKLAQESDPRRVRIAVDLTEELVEAGELSRADQLLTEIEHDPDVSALAALTRFEWMVSVGAPDAPRAIESRLPGILEEFARVGDERGLARGHLVAFFLHWFIGHATAAGDEARLAAEHARNAGDDGLRERALSGYVGTLRYGRVDARTAAQEIDAIEREQPGPYLAASMDAMRGEIARMDGRFSEARRLARRASEGFRTLGVPELEGGYEMGRGELELSIGDAKAALQTLRRSDEILAQLGARAVRSTAQALLGQAHWELGDRDAAMAAIELAEELGDPADVANPIITHGVRASMALADGDGAAAERWARSAVDHASRTDGLLWQANAKLDLARVLSALNRPEAAIPEARAALDLFQAKGDRPGAAKTRDLLDELGVDR